MGARHSRHQKTSFTYQFLAAQLNFLLQTRVFLPFCSLHVLRGIAEDQGHWRNWAEYRSDRTECLRSGCRRFSQAGTNKIIVIYRMDEPSPINSYSNRCMLLKPVLNQSPHLSMTAYFSNLQSCKTTFILQ